MKIFFSQLCVLLITQSLSAQKIKLLSGSLKELKGQKSYDITFTYDSIIIGTNMPEKDYLKEKKRQWDVKEPGKGDAFEAMWFNGRKKSYEPAFIKNFEHYSYIKLRDTTAKYTLIVKTSRVEAGWDIGVASHPGEIDAELWVVESKDKNKVIAKILCDKSKGKDPSGGDFEMTYRIKSAYVQAGKWLGDFMRRKSK